MTIDERHRLALHEAARAAFGEAPALTLMELLPPVGWADVATVRDLNALRADVHAEIADLRGELRVQIGELHGQIGELHGGIGELRGDLRVELAALSQKLVLWLVGAVLATFTASLAVRLV